MNLEQFNPKNEKPNLEQGPAKKEFETIKVISEVSPSEVHVEKILEQAKKEGCLKEALTSLSFLEAGSPFVRPKGKEAEADKIKNKFAYEGSDFVTFLNVWREYEAHNFDSEWARNNFLRERVLTEAKSKREQLFSSMELEKDMDKNINPDAIGKSIAAGFINYSLLEMLGRHGYIKTNQSEPRKKDNLYIHPSSVVFSLEPRFIVGAEIIKDLEKRKNYLKYVQEVKGEWIRELAPSLIVERSRRDQYPQERKDLHYDPVNDRVVETFDIYVGFGNREPIMTEERLIEGREAAAVLARELVSRRIDVPASEHNKQVIETLNNLWHLDKSKLGNLKEPYSTRNLQDFYQVRLGTISSRRELEKAIEDGNVNLQLNLDNFISLEKRIEIMQDNPDDIDVAGANKTYHVNYGDGGVEPSIRINIKDVFNWREFPHLPSGKFLKLEWADLSHFSPRKPDGDLEGLKKWATERYLDKQFYEFRNAHIKEIENFYQLDALPQLPEPIPYARNPLTDEEVYAYAGIGVDDGSGLGGYGDSVDEDEYEFYIKYFQTKEAADRSQTEAIELFEKWKK